MSLRFTERMERCGTEGAFEVLAQARRLEAQGRDIVHLEIGEPDFATPENITEAAITALREGYTHYTPASGIMRARESAAAYVARRTGVEVAAEDVVLVPGSKNLVHFALLALVEEGDEVIVPDPGYPAYRSLVDFVGARPVTVPIREEGGFRLDVDELSSLVGPRTRMIVLNSPANPTGGCLERADVEAIAEIAMANDLVVVSDEIYGRLLYEGEHASILSVPGMRERTVYMDGMSKTWAMCGWRLGFGVMPRALAQRMDTLMINTSSCAAAFTQMAAVEAFESPESDAAVAAMVEEFRARRDLVVDGLRAIPGIRCHRPRGAFYVFPNVEGTGVDEATLAHDLLLVAGVAVLPGTAFGYNGRGYIRLSYANSRSNILAALQRIATHLAGGVRSAAG
ncbi:MAG TPA: pyridoxal phosphate-dependent aminotransferase [Candidatus Dormibacteraeota bacterium]|nr:pyridoxal phosphate-dependent aminotransferase [Candidatus Dormibacteraeota bacterium]